MHCELNEVCGVWLCISRRYLVMLVAAFVFALVALHSTALLRCRCVCSILGAWLSNSCGCARISATRLQTASQALVHHFGFVAYIYLVPLVCTLALCAFSHCMQLCIQVFRRACCCVHLDIVCIHAFRCLSGVICACCCMHSDLVRIQVLRRARYCMHLHFVCMHACIQALGRAWCDCCCLCSRCTCPFRHMQCIHRCCIDAVGIPQSA